MADYFTQAVMTPAVRLTPAMREAPALTNATVESEEGCLDSVFWSETPTDPDGSEVEERLGSFERAEDAAEFQRLAGLLVNGKFEHFLREVLAHNPEVRAIEVHKAFTCSRMRADGFGGEGVYVTRTQYAVVGDRSVVVDEQTGEIRPDVTITAFEPPAPPRRTRPRRS